MYQWLPKVLILLLGPVYAICLFAPAFGQVHDDSVYLVSSRALANGAGYVVDSLPEPIPQTKYPILYPAILAVFWKFTNNLATVALLSKLLSLLSTIAWILVLRRLIHRQLASPVAADWIVFLGVSVPWTVFLATSILPDTLFAFLTTWALDLMLEHELPNAPPLNWKTVIGIAVLASSAFLIRTTGLALLLAVLFILLRRRFQLSLVFLAVCAAICGPWLLWQATQPVPIDEAQRYYSKLSYAQGHLLAGFRFGQMFKIVFSNAIMLGTFFMGVFYKLPVLGALTLAAILGYFAVTGWFRDLRNGAGILSVWAFLYAGILIAWVWPPYRYMLPLVPIALLFKAKSIMSVRRTPGRTKLLHASLLIYTCGVILTNCVNVYRTLQLQSTVIGWGETDKWSNQLQLAEWIRSATPTNAIVAANIDPTVYLMTGRKSIRLIRFMPFELTYGAEGDVSTTRSAEEVRRHLRNNRVTHVLMLPTKRDSEDRFFWQAFKEIKRNNPDAFRMVKNLPDEGYEIYEVNQVKL
jgi:hypothetical protein